MFKVNNKDTRTTPTVNFEHVNAGWVYNWPCSETAQAVKKGFCKVTSG